MSSAYLRVALAATAWGTWSLFLRPAAVDPRWSSALMLAVVALAAAPLLLGRRARGPSEGPPRRAAEWWAVVGLGVFDACNAGLFFGAMSVTSVAVAVLSHYLAPVLVALAAPWVLRTPRSKGALPMALVALLGLSLVLEPWRADGVVGRPTLGAALGAGSALFYAANVLITKRVGPRFTAEELLVYHSVLSSAILAAVAWGLRAPPPTPRGAALVVLASLVVGATAGLAFLRGLARIPAEHAGMLTFLEPLTAVMVAWAWWGERPGLSAALGGALVLGAGALAIRSGANPPELERAPAASIGYIDPS
jgi:DME family drug/metabolite transporter